MTGPRDITARQAAVAHLIHKHQLNVRPFGKAGAVRVHGPGVDVSAAGMQWLNVTDVTPTYSERKSEDSNNGN